ncbi:hypothetical protein, partial [Pseudomonas chlororaphis]|uniref:hypothetical protein n=1 Tax=Pseudomonas chlororaphis TaxID=587753 RepID=UPI0019656C3A
EAAIRPAGPWFPILRQTSRGLQNATAVPADRSLRQQLHESLSALRSPSDATTDFCVTLAL